LDEFQYFDKVIHCQTNSFSKTCTGLRTNHTAAMKGLEKKGIVKSGLIEPIKDPHSKRIIWCVNDHDRLLRYMPNIKDYYLNKGRTIKWVNNITEIFCFSAVYYKYATGKNIQYKFIQGFLDNGRNNIRFRNLARNCIDLVPFTSLCEPSYVLYETTN
jgi:hypothetical protein